MEHKFQKCKNHCCRSRGSGSMCNWTNLSNLFFQTFFSFFSRTSSSLNYCWTWTPEPTKMVFTFLESVLQDGEFEYFWRSVRPLEKKLYEFKTIILKIVKKIQKSSKINSFFSSHSFSSSGRTDLQKYSSSPSWSTDSKNVKTIFVGPGV